MTKGVMRYLPAILLLLPVGLCLSACQGWVREAANPSTLVPDSVDMTAELVAGATINGVLDEPFAFAESGVHYGKPFVEGAASRPVVRQLPFGGFIDVDGDGTLEAARLIVANTGGSGSYVYLVIIDARDGIAQSVFTKLLGDRLRVETMTIDGSRIVLETIEHGPLDPMCCPSQAWRRTWGVIANELQNVASERRDDAAFVARDPTSDARRYRGHVVLGHEMRSFTECKTGREAWIVNAGDRSELTAIYEQLASEPYQPIFFEFDGMMASPLPGEGFAADFEASISVLRVHRAQREGFGCNEDLAGVVFRAHGNEPPWRADVRSTAVVLRQPHGEGEYAISDIRADNDTITVNAAAGGALLELVLRRNRCTDSMSGSLFEYAAALKRADGVLNGCAVRGR